MRSSTSGKPNDANEANKKQVGTLVVLHSKVKTLRALLSLCAKLQGSNTKSSIVWRTRMWNRPPICCKLASPMSMGLTPVLYATL